MMRVTLFLSVLMVVITCVAGKMIGQVCTMAVDKFFSLGVLTISTHHKQLCTAYYVLYPSHRNAPSTYWLHVLGMYQIFSMLCPCVTY